MYNFDKLQAVDSTCVAVKPTVFHIYFDLNFDFDPHHPAANCQFLIR